MTEMMNQARWQLIFFALISPALSVLLTSSLPVIDTVEKVLPWSRPAHCVTEAESVRWCLRSAVLAGESSARAAATRSPLIPGNHISLPETEGLKCSCKQVIEVIRPANRVI